MQVRHKRRRIADAFRRSTRLIAARRILARIPSRSFASLSLSSRTNSGMLNTQNLMGALAQVGVPITRLEAEEVISHYSDKGDYLSLIHI